MAEVEGSFGERKKKRKKKKVGRLTHNASFLSCDVRKKKKMSLIRKVYRDRKHHRVDKTCTDLVVGENSSNEYGLWIGELTMTFVPWEDRKKKKRDVFATEDRVEIVAKYQDVPYLRRINVLNLRSTARTVLGCCATRPPFPSFSLSFFLSSEQIFSYTGELRMKSATCNKPYVRCWVKYWFSHRGCEMF